MHKLNQELRVQHLIHLCIDLPVLKVAGFLHKLRSETHIACPCEGASRAIISASRVLVFVFFRLIYYVKFYLCFFFTV